MNESKITFTAQVKEEICSNEINEEQLLSLLAGFVKVNGSLHLSQYGMELSLQNENSKIMKLIYNAFKTLFNVSPTYSYHRKMHLDKSVVFGVHIKEQALEILEKLQLMNNGIPSFPKEIVLEERLRYFIAGAFLASGSVNSPHSKCYHLQMVVNDEDDAKYFLKLLNRFRNEKTVSFKIISRRNKFVLYLKKADQIATFLSIIRAHDCLMDFENVRIEKDFFNSDNRIQVCINANYQKSLAKGQQQIKEIKYLRENYKDLNFSEKERIICDIRLNNEELSLQGISLIAEKEYNISISKSGVNHILNKVHNLYLECTNDK